MRAAVVGHIEWVDFARVERVPRAGEIVTALDSWAEPAGGGGVAAVQLARMAGGATFLTALGDDELGRRVDRELRALGVDVQPVWRPEPQRRAFTFVDDRRERTITVIGERLDPRADDPLPWSQLADADGLYFTAGDVGALRHARRARVLVATARILPVLQRAGVELDALVHSEADPSERYAPGDLDPPPKLVVTTRGPDGGHWRAGEETGTWEAAPLRRPLVDTYGAGDSFAAGLTYGLAEGREPHDAVVVAAEWAAAALGRRGAHG